MHVEEDENGNFYVVDEPMRLEGEDAERFLAEMNRPRSPEEIAKRQAFLAECTAIYEHNIAQLRR
jgi:hypothetical protein